MKSTVFIIGAGASIPFGYPSGSELVEQILKSFDPNYLYEFSYKHKDIKTGEIQLFPARQVFADYGLYLKNGFTKEHISEFAEALKNSFKDSIDSFLLGRSEFYEIGKFAIANCILKCELPGEFIVQPQNWLRYIWQKINADRNTFVSSNLSFITFNYDRVLEYFFYNALKHSFNLNERDLRSLLNDKPIIHLHGVIGSLPWQDKNEGFEYNYDGQNIDQFYSRIVAASKRIRLIYDNRTKEFEEMFEQAYSLLENASDIYTIGFGFHKLNLNRLKIDKIKVQLKCSAFGLTKHECLELEQLYGDKLFLDKNNYDSLAFLRNYLTMI
jgi:hypothetical protein